MATIPKNISNILKPSRVIWPILIGLAVVTYMFVNTLSKERYEKAPKGKGDYEWVDANEDGKPSIKEYHFVGEDKGEYHKITYTDLLRSVNWTMYSLLWIFVSILMMVVRDVAYMYRIKVMTDNHLSWRSSFETTMLWEFASAVSPSVVGGSAVAIFIVNKEGISVGRSTAIVLLTTLLDELFYVFMVPLILLIVGTSDLFPDNMSRNLFGVEFNATGIFLLGYFLISLYSVVVSYGIFVRPRGFKWLLIKVFSLPLLRKWRISAAQTGDEIILASQEFRGKSFGFWFKAAFSTFLSWTGRYWVTNFIILAFFAVDNHFLIYARQLVMWVIMLISPTPGGSGLAEFAFSGFIGEFIKTAGLIGTVALIWRLISYYPYLFIGAIILPRWLRRVYTKTEETEEQA